MIDWSIRQVYGYPSLRLEIYAKRIRPNDADRHPKTPKHHFHDIPPNREIHFVFEINIL